MKRIFLFTLLLGGFISGCNDNGGSETSSSDSLTTEHNNAATAGTDTTSANNTSSATTGSTLKGVMDKMMQDMHSMTMTEDPDHDFAMMMKAHHQGAIDMANIEISQGKNEQLKEAARKMVTDAQKDMEELNSFLNSHEPDKKSDFAKKAMDKMMNMSGNNNMDHGGDVDMEFAMMMEMHHQHGIDMSRDYLKVATEAQTKKVANNTIKTNAEDIKKLKSLQSKSGTDHSGH